jgi:hypothetical protein
MLTGTGAGVQSATIKIKCNQAAQRRQRCGVAYKTEEGFCHIQTLINFSVVLNNLHDL